jgi:hypothetical protein
MSPHDVHTMELRLWITVAGGTISVAAGVIMMATYRRYRQQLTNPYNDLFILGLGGMQWLQSIQFVFFAVIHLSRLHDFSGPLCAANAMLDQFFNFAGQVFALGFMVSLFTLRGHFDCCFRSSLSLSEQSRGTTMPYSRAEHFLHRSYGSQLSAVDGGVSTPRPLNAIGRRQSCCAATNVTRIAWSLAAVVGGLGTTAWMSAVVMQDVNEAPVAHQLHPENFEMGLGWCWIPNGHDTLRLFCCYILAFMTLLCGTAAAIYLFRHEVVASFRMHLMIYVRVGLLLSWLLFAYLIGAVSRFTTDRATNDNSSYVATGVFALNETFICAIFVGTERLWGPLRIAVQNRFRGEPEELPGNGFSSCVNHLLLMEVEGVPLPMCVTSAETTRYRFESDATGGIGGSMSNRNFLEERESLVASSCFVTNDRLM